MLAQGFTAVCGIDEAGCGPLAGAVYAAAVILNPNDKIDGVDDSKKLSDKKRRALYEQITSRALSFAIASVSAEQIDEINILQARLLAMRMAVKQLHLPCDFALVDGNRDPQLEIPTLCIIGGDRKSASIAAASILAKVARDDEMERLDKLHPEYLFAKHKGYPTKLHRELILKHGACPEHRATFLTKILKGEPK